MIKWIYNLRFLTLLLGLALLSGCAAPGPMKTLQGPMNTPAFEPIVLSIVDDGSDNVLFKEWSGMYEDKKWRMRGVFFVTEHSIYLAEWDMRAYDYNIRYSLPIAEVAELTDHLVERTAWINSNILLIKDSNGHEVGFSISGRNAVRSIVRNSSSIEKEG